jgi:hypothetical protein
VLWARTGFVTSWEQKHEDEPAEDMCKLFLGSFAAKKSNERGEKANAGTKMKSRPAF